MLRLCPCECHDPKRTVLHIDACCHTCPTCGKPMVGSPEEVWLHETGCKARHDRKKKRKAE